jgi:hypothetical protein
MQIAKVRNEAPDIFGLPRVLDARQKSESEEVKYLDNVEGARILGKWKKYRFC